MVAELRVGVVDESLRERIRVQTADVRNLILAYAFQNQASRRLSSETARSPSG